ncbi:ATP-binding protein [Streptomyces sp. NBC_00233]|uniref:ATP-binding protein n=1 Tax=Streptomyces sp. NBC_00233 TaxID=2975686 RepID=UPI002257BEBD|nr:ATP-binding protein [Streptomyces sp. NBC_00233]MCX5233066.1 ATP-binding protein [Streptomyces sp. NBC_00233]
MSSELITKPAERAQASLYLRLHLERLGNQVRVGVTDGAWATSCTEDEPGRRLGILEVPADAHGARPRHHPLGTIRPA